MAEIVLEDVHLKFRIRQARRITLKEYLVRGLFRESANPRTEVHALSGISLRLGEGDRLGVIGHNGAGKSTLLKLMAGIYPPTAGRRRVEGNVCSLFDIALGFESESNGWDNIHYRGYLQGETPATIKDKIAEIAAFSELGDFLDIPVRYYSAGMLVRLAFSIASAIRPEILLIDEVLSVGDMAFQAKARQRMMDMMRSARLMVLISHDLETLPKVCTKVAWMDRGSLRMVGPTEEVIRRYVASVKAAKAAPAAAAA